MRVSIIGPAFPLRGGIAHHVYWLHQELTRHDHQVQVVSFLKLYPKLLFPGTTEYDASQLKLDANATPILKPLNPFTWLRALKAVKSFSPNVVIFEWWQPFFGPLTGTLARWLRKAGIKCVIECHNLLPHEPRVTDSLFTRYALSSVDHLITHSSKDKADLLSMLPGKDVSVSPLPSLVEFSRTQDTKRSGNTILFFGKVRKYKGLDVLLAALPRVLSKIECRLLVVGEFYDSIARYQRLIRELKIESHVQIDNRYVPNEEVPEIFERADVLVLPYLSATQSAVARIALSNKLPVIASRTGGLTEAIIENVNGLLFPPGDAEGLADKLISYFSDKLGPVLTENLQEAQAETSCSIVETIEKLIEHSSTLPAENCQL
jgi:glycosyltransferase involved in cell wall biosynthesis